MPSPDCSDILFWRGTKPEKIERKAGKSLKRITLDAIRQRSEEQNMSVETKKSRINRDFFYIQKYYFNFFFTATSWNASMVSFISMSL